MSYIRKLNKKQLITPPNHVVTGIQYEVIMGSVAYGVSSDTSDIDIYGFSIPYKNMVFPHLNNEILGFDNQTKRFNQFHQHNIKDVTTDKKYDISIYSIIRYFRLCMDNNPNMIDSLFVPRRCILYTTQLGEMVREKRKIFLHKGSYPKFKGYSYSQLHKMNIKKPNPSSKRYDSIIKHGFDLKFAYHIVRLLNEAEQILVTGDLNLEQNREQLKSIRRGEWKKEDIINYFETKEKALEQLYLDSNLPYKPDEKQIKQLLIDCLEQHFGSLNNIIKKDNNGLINELKYLIQKWEK